MGDPRNRAYSLLYSNPIWIGKRFLQNLVLRLAINVGVLGAIAEDLRISGESDGYEGTKPQHPDVDYLQGYVEGCRRKLAEVQAQLAEFEKETAWIEEF